MSHLHTDFGNANRESPPTSLTRRKLLNFRSCTWNNEKRNRYLSLNDSRYTLRSLALLECIGTTTAAGGYVEGNDDTTDDNVADESSDCSSPRDYSHLKQ